MKKNHLSYAVCILAICLMLARFDGANAQSCYQSSIVSPQPFMGNNGEVFRLADGTFWEIKYEYEYLYEYYPEVVICPGVGKLMLKGKTLNVQFVGDRSAGRPSREQNRSVIASQISGEFTGWEGETIFQLTNGQIWQQASYAYTYHYAYMPKVFILPVGGGYEMQVEGVSSRIRVVRLK